MQTIILTPPGDPEFGPRFGSIAAQPIAGDGALHAIATVKHPNGVGAGLLYVRGYVGSGPINGFRLSKALIPDGAMRATLVNDDFDTPSTLMPWTSTTGAGPSLFKTGANGTFEFALDTRGMTEVLIEASALAATTLALEFSY